MDDGAWARDSRSRNTRRFIYDAPVGGGPSLTARPRPPRPPGARRRSSPLVDAELADKADAGGGRAAAVSVNSSRALVGNS